MVDEAGVDLYVAYSRSWEYRSVRAVAFRPGGYSNATRDLNEK